jgi:hypothetical protein
VKVRLDRGDRRLALVGLRWRSDRLVLPGDQQHAAAQQLLAGRLTIASMEV